MLRVVGALPPLFAAGEGRIDLDAAGEMRGLFDTERQIIGRLKDEGLPGVYLATSGVPGTAREILS
ncbi:MAG: hypothetical protein JRN70_02985 [Nitrososphaerota archaeon]|nr:hypothetical protein [Nitrososphaerota archaeon]